MQLNCIVKLFIINLKTLLITKTYEFIKPYKHINKMFYLQYQTQKIKRVSSMVFYKYYLNSAAKTFCKII